ncbi:hypothetical protein, partial [Leptolyngbya sp. PCC 6406]|uniref:hypothetical protein n=1 Tax=Leptolyngbya sp. PCC 6406 TaxID=1173264 RepID=UPI0004809569
MRTSRLVVTLLLVAVLVTFALQNTTPVLPLVFLGGRTVALPLAIWIMGAIALGSITALILIGLVSGIGGSPQKSRRRWRVQPEPEPRSPQSSPQDSSPRAN